MPNIVNRLSLQEFTQGVEGMGSCIVLCFDKMTVAQVSELREQFRERELTFKVVKNRLAVRALSTCGYEVGRLTGKCGLVLAPEENAITAAKLVTDFAKKNKDMTLEVLAGVIEGEVMSGDDAKQIAEMPDKDTVRAQIATAISAPARALATVLAGVGTGLARCLDQRAEGKSE